MLLLEIIWPYFTYGVCKRQKALVHLIMFEKELIMFEQMPELELMNILCYKAIFDHFNLTKDMCKHENFSRYFLNISIFS